MNLSRIAKFSSILLVLLTYLRPAGLAAADPVSFDGMYDISWNIQFTGDRVTSGTFTKDFPSLPDTETITRSRNTHHEGNYTGSGVFKVSGSNVTTVSVSNVHAYELVDDKGGDVVTHSGVCPQVDDPNRTYEFRSETTQPDLFHNTDTSVFGDFKFQPIVQPDGTYEVDNVITDPRFAPVHLINFDQYTHCDGSIATPTNIDGTFSRQLMTALANLSGITISSKLISTDNTGTKFVQNTSLQDQEYNSQGIKYTGTIQITITRRGLKPVALFTSAPTKIDKQVTLDASGSHPTNGGSIIQYDWEFGDGTTATTASPITTHTFPEHDKDYTVSLTVSDNSNTKSDPYMLTVHSPKIVPTASFTVFIHSGGKVEFDGTGSTPSDPSNPITNYKWTFDDNSPAVDFNIPTTDHDYDYFTLLTPFKKYKATLVVTDSAGNKSDPATHDIDVCSPDLPPTSAHDYTGLVRCVEIALPDQSPRQILSTMRKLYYGSQSWSNRRISFWDNVIQCGQDVPNPVPAFSSKLYNALIVSANQNQIGEGDITHVFTTLEAMDCPTNTVVLTPVVQGLPSSYWTVKMPNYFFASWGGDVGSAVGQKAIDDYTSKSNGWPYYIGPNGNYAGFDDLNGDTDGLVLGHVISGASCSDSPASLSLVVPLSQTLRQYYPDPLQPFNTPQDYKNRIKCLDDILGAGSNQLKDPQQLIERYKEMVYEFAIPWYYGRITVVNNLVKPGITISTLKNYSPVATGIYFDWLLSQQ